MRMSPQLRNQQRLIQLFDETSQTLVCYVNQDGCLSVYDPERMIQATFLLMDHIALNISIGERPGYPAIHETLIPIPADATDSMLATVVDTLINHFKKY